MSKWRNGWNDTEIYSTSEVKTNKVWIDGKPIYRTVFKTNTPQTITSGGAVTLNFANVSGLNIESVTNTRLSLSTGNPQFGDTAHIAIDISSGSISTLPRYGLNYNVDTFIIEYTKTTD